VPFLPELSFFMIDRNTQIEKNDALIMPLLFVDGMGIQFSPSGLNPMGNAEFRDLDNNLTTLAESVLFRYSYEMQIPHDNALIVARYDRERDLHEHGAFARDGSVIADFKFHTLSPFFGGYAIGGLLEGGLYHYYRIDKAGNETLLSNVREVLNGVYVTREGNRYALFANSGAELIPMGAHASISVAEIFLTGGRFVQTLVWGERDGRGVIYRLS
jgi:hypothetical protein